MKVRNLFFSLLAAFTIIFSVASCAMIGDEIGENKSSFFTLAIRSSGSRSARSSSTTYTPVDIVTNFTESQFRETVTRFVIKINNEPEIIASLGSAVESREEYPIGSQVTVSYTAYGNIDFTGSSQTTMTNTRKEVIIASETQTVTVEAGGTNVYFNVKKGLKNADPYTINTYDITYQPYSPDPFLLPSGIPDPQTDIEENTAAQISSQTPSISGYGFSYWLGDDDKRYNPGDQVTMTKNLGLLPQWTAYDNLYVSDNGDDSNSGTSASPFVTIDKAFEIISGYTNKQAVTIHVLGTIQINSTIALNDSKNITIQGSGNSKLIRNATCQDALFIVQQGTLNLSNITVDVDNSYITNADSPFILVEGGTLHIQTGTILQNNNNTSFSDGGGAIRMASGTLTIDSDPSISITSNKATWGGGIYVTGGTVNMNDDSVISGNSAPDGGTNSDNIYIGAGVTYNGRTLSSGQEIMQ